MKTTLFICLFSIWTTPFFAQPIITSADLLKVGDIVITQPCATTTFIPQSGGANKTWDFTQLVAEGPEDTTFYISPVGTPYAADFPNSNIVALFESNQYGYYQTVDDKLFYWGQKDPSSALVLSNPATYFKSPATFGTFVLDTIEGSLSSGPLNAMIIGHVFFEGDGYGTLTTPGGQYSDVLRVKTSTIAIATVPFLGTITDSVINYSWYKLGIKSPVLEMIEDTQWSNGAVIDQTRYVNYYRSLTTTTQIVNNTIEIKAFPNPASDQVQFSGLEEPARLTVQNSAGQLVMDKDITPNEVISVKSLSSGVYFCSIYSTKNATRFVKLVVR